MIGRVGQIHLESDGHDCDSKKSGVKEVSKTPQFMM